jgi:AcrR family transcriptional regulator
MSSVLYMDRATSTAQVTSHRHRMAALRRSKREESGWQSTKSEWTRTQILSAAIHCFSTLGFSKTSTRDIALEAHVSRGALVHHFPTRHDLLQASIDYLHRQRLDDFTARMMALPAGADRTDAGIEAYWAHLCTPASAIFMNLRMTARADEELADILNPCLIEFEVEWNIIVRKLFPEWSRSESLFQRAMDLTQFLMEGMALHYAGNDDAHRYADVRDDLKARLKKMLMSQNPGK